MNDTMGIKKELVIKLKTISEDEDFIVGVVSNAKHNDDRKTLIEYIDKGEEVTYEQLLLLSVYLAKNREKITS